jgi:leucyl-tRNA synthetase
VPVNVEDLPVRLPEDVTITGTGESPIVQAASFVNTTCPKCSGPHSGETDTMDTFVESSWYFIGYCSPNHPDRPFDRARWTTGCPWTSTSAASSTRFCT